jgi:hypothetical protein
LTQNPNNKIKFFPLRINTPLLRTASIMFALITGNAYDRCGDTRAFQMLDSVEAINVMVIN